jgi:hypothetical protein
MKALLLLLTFLAGSFATLSQTINVLEKTKISQTHGSLGLSLVNNGQFGSVANLGDHNLDGTTDLIVGAPARSDGGAAYVLFLNSTGAVNSSVQIGLISGGFYGDIAVGDLFGQSVAAIGDVDGDGIGDIAIGAPGKATGILFNSGAVWIVLLNANGTVKEQIKIAHGQNGFPSVLAEEDYFGTSIAVLGDLNGDGINEIAVGAPGDDDGGTNRGAFYVLFLTTNGQVSSTQKVSYTTGGFNEYLDNGDNFGYVSAVGDLNNDGIIDLAVGAPGDDDGGTDFGAFYLCIMNSSGTIQSQQKISAAQGGFSGFLNTGDQFGICAASMGDIDGDGMPDIIVGAPGDDDGNIDAGACWVLLLNPNFTVKQRHKISRLEGGFGTGIGLGDRFGSSVCSLGDFNGDGSVDFAAGVPFNDDGGTNRGAIYLTMLNVCSAPSADFNFNQEGNSITFIPEDDSAESYFWYFDDGWFSNEASPTHTYAQNGFYQVCLTTTSACGSSNNCLLISVLTTNDNENISTNLSVFPVPSSDYIRITGIEITGNTTIVAVAINGKTTPLELINGVADISNLAAGIYAAIVSKSDQEFHFRFVKE